MPADSARPQPVPAVSPDPAPDGREASTIPKVREPWRAALLLPERWDDLRQCVSDFRRLDEGPEPVLLRGVVATAAATRFREKGVPQTTVFLEDAQGLRVGVSFFGDVRAHSAQWVPGAVLHVRGTLRRVRDQYWLGNPELVDTRWLGKWRPAYASPARSMKAETVRARVLAQLPQAIPVAAEWIFQTTRTAAAAIDLPVQLDRVKIERWLWEAHTPEDASSGAAAQRRIEKLAALATLAKAYAPQAVGTVATALDLGGWERRLERVPFQLTAEQREAVRAIVRQMRSTQPQRHLLSGDVGTGKTVVFALAAAANHDAGHHTAIMLPNQPLAAQVAREIRGLWPDVTVFEVTGDLRKGAWRESDGPCVFVGTTALLSRMPGQERRRLALVVVDEQQKYSVEQRERLAQHGAHVIEATATCIPRTMALVRYGAVEISQLRQAHTQKRIVTEVVDAAAAARVYRQAVSCVERGFQVLVVYPLKEDSRTPDNRQALQNAARWWIARWGDRVSVISGAMDDEEKREALRRLRDGEADVLIGTTVVEVGINLPLLRHVIITDATRYGLTQIHQLRGRAARNGGTGLCSLIVPDGVSAKARARLAVLERTQDGFAIAEADLRLRGFGELAATQGAAQSGADETFLVGRPIDIDLADEVAEVIQRRLADRAAAAPTPGAGRR